MVQQTVVYKSLLHYFPFSLGQKLGYMPHHDSGRVCKGLGEVSSPGSIEQADNFDTPKGACGLYHLYQNTKNCSGLSRQGCNFTSTSFCIFCKHVFDSNRVFIWDWDGLPVFFISSVLDDLQMANFQNLVTWNTKRWLNVDVQPEGNAPSTTGLSHHS